MLNKLFHVLLLSCLCSHALAAEPHAVALIYHHIDSTTPKSTSVSPAQFKQQLDYLHENDFKVLPLPTIVRKIASGESLPDKVVALTFDDAYRSVYSEAYPLLKQRNWPFTVFVNTEAIDQKSRLHTSWEQLREMAASGATIANHSVTHAHLVYRLPNETTNQWQQRVSGEIKHAQKRIKAELGTAEKLFAYPYGEYDSALQQLLRELGYTAFGQQSGAWGTSTDKQAIPRFAAAGDYANMDEFKLKVATLPFAISKIAAADNPLPHNQQQPPLRITFMSGNYQQLNCYGTGQGALALEWESPTTVVIKPNKAIPVGRSRVNCTLPTGNGRFYWYSHQWIRLDKNNQWILD